HDAAADRHAAGGIVPRITGLLSHADFRRRFETKGRFGVWLQTVPAAVLVDPYAALRGAANAWLSSQSR
ncbi:MAG TPA: glucokinase, partial [Burkholderiaceae bacterium]|nr:glucokinase [Burkholderiaceae bacterium]